MILKNAGSFLTTSTDFPREGNIRCPMRLTSALPSYFRYCPEDLKPELARNILKFAAAYGVDVESPTVLSYAK